jgi:HK97 family phage major capsid protein
MGTYLDRLHAQYDEITGGNTEILERAAAENRELTDDEKSIVERDDTRRDELAKAIEHYTARAERDSKVVALRSRVPAGPTTVRSSGNPEPEYDICRDFPTPGDWAVAVHRARIYRDQDAAEKLERATAHQTTADNPGLIPRPILGPLISSIDTTRPFIQAVSTKSLPTGKFDRPTVTQHVKVGKQTAEKALTDSQQMVIGTIPVSAATYAGHVNVSRQDVKWTSPAILNILFQDFAAIYAQTTDADAAAQFLATLNPANTQDIATLDTAGINTALYAAAAAGYGRAKKLPDTSFVSVDVWASLGGLTNNLSGTPSYPGLSLTNMAGNPMGLKLCVDPNFPAGTWVIGPAAVAEWYEDVDGLMQVQEPDVLGQLVGYAGYGAYVNTAPDAFTKMTLPAGP